MRQMISPVLLNIDCHSLPVTDLDAAIEFYSSLGHEVIWKDESAAGLRLPESEAELVLHTDDRPLETDFKVASVPKTIDAFTRAGGRVVVEPFEIRIGLCAVLLDPWNNSIVVLDTSKGVLVVDENKNITGNADV
jgi:predicted enzyme related to lactoylglutathione lyase